VSLDRLLQRAFARGPAHRANQLIHEARQQVAARCGRGQCYEVSLLEGPFGEARGWDHLDRLVAPRLAFFLRSKKLGVADSGPVFLAVFVGETVYFIEVADFFELIRQARGLDAAGFDAVVRGWERTGRDVIALLPEGEDGR
jgi:hypothetical protein